MQRLVTVVVACCVLGVVLNASAQVRKKKKNPAPVAAQSGDPKHLPQNAVKNLDVHPELQATLFASEKDGITNPTNLDIDHRGRVWICDVINYRGNNGKRPEGDRILILEDADGDGKCDKVKTFYQGRDVDSAMGICVLGNRVIVSATPNVFVFHFDENDKITKREVLFSRSGQPQHDHSLHSFVFGPDGRLYWNFGNTGRSMNDQNGKPIVDLAGNKVNDSGNPYRQGMIFRMDTPWLKKGWLKKGSGVFSGPDATKGPGAGVNFETLAWNFRNNYEVCVDSFGSMWQSDNDDDGNRGVRINFVMEFGNYGYVDEMTGAGWQTKRTNMEKEIPQRHWHLNDPGVVPTLLLTGAGSPCGITIYEGTLLPKVFHGQMIHADAGPSIVRAYPVTKDGAGYKATTVNMLDGNKKNNWFRPADVCVAPDGSLFVTDWYDPGVGGHAQRDLDRGRIFRVAPPGNKPSVPKFDFTTADGAVEALKSPNLAARYLAWTALHEMGAKAEQALFKAWKSDDERLRARSIWLLGHIPNRADYYVHTALKDLNDDIRIVGVRLARQLKTDLNDLFALLYREPTASVRREAALGLRHYKDAAKSATYWLNLASKHQGEDRWYLEALGIAVGERWDAFVAAYLQLLGADGPAPKVQANAMRDIVWRSRAATTAELLGRLIQNHKTPSQDLPRFFRAFDFQKDSDLKNAALVKLAFGDVGDPERQRFITAEALARIKSLDLKANPQYADAVNKLLDRSKNTATFVEIVAKFNVSERYPELLAIAQRQPGEQFGVDAMRLLLERDAKLVKPGLANKDVQIAAATVQAIGNAANPSANPLLLPIVEDRKADLELRRQATRALARTKPGALLLIKLAREKKLDEQLKIAAASGIGTLPGDDVRRQAFGLFPFPTTKAELPIAPIRDLVKQKGNVAKGATIFAKAGTCVNCHVVNGAGKQVGPDLSEIGKKLSKEALYESILYPSAGISHNFETWIAETTKGEIIQGVMISQTPADVVLKDKDALLRTFKRNELEDLVKSPISLMPADLHKNLTTQDLADVVEYMLTLREARKK
ncbi:MAG: c-type cytochrome [Gemmataceae bacterium]|nr:c-type cytochrome [Gemmataceae bacterium]